MIISYTPCLQYTLPHWLIELVWHKGRETESLWQRLRSHMSNAKWTTTQLLWRYSHNGANKFQPYLSQKLVPNIELIRDPIVFDAAPSVNLLLNCFINSRTMSHLFNTTYNYFPSQSVESTNSHLINDSVWAAVNCPSLTVLCRWWQPYRGIKSFKEKSLKWIPLWI